MKKKLRTNCNENRRIRHRSLLLMLCTFLLLCVSACTPGCILERNEGINGKETLAVMSWNVENLFDGERDGTEYSEFDPTGGRWDSQRYHVRLELISRLILDLADPLPDIICLQEVEHAGVVEDLKSLYLAKKGFIYSAVTSDPNSAVQQAVISRFPITESRVHAVTGVSGFRVRQVLEVTITAGSGQLTLFNSHWKSRLGGAEETEPARIETAAALRRIASERLTRNPDALIILAGDFNTAADESARTGGTYPTALSEYPRIGQGLTVTGDPQLCTAAVFYSPWSSREECCSTAGSYSYRHQWSAIDHILCSSAAFDGNSWDFHVFDVLAHPDLLSDDGEPIGWSKATGRGYSDHLPVYAVFRDEEIPGQRDQSPRL
jgi:endonuclease/exonuclease/phosphatase family metal-dependent hydrolase